MSVICSKCGKNIFVLGRWVETITGPGDVRREVMCDGCFTENLRAKQKITRERAIEIMPDIIEIGDMDQGWDYEEEQTLVMASAALSQQSATLALLHDLRRYLHDSTGSSLELDTRREKLHGMVVDRIRELEDTEKGDAK